MLARMDLAAIGDLADVEPVLQEMGEWANTIAGSGDRPSICQSPWFRFETLGIERCRERADRAQTQIALEDRADEICLLRNDLQFLVDAAIAERHRTADPDALALGGGDLVAHPLADHLPLELGERQQHVERQPAHARRGVERLGHRDERHVMLWDGRLPLSCQHCSAQRREACHLSYLLSISGSARFTVTESTATG